MTPAEVALLVTVIAAWLVGLAAAVLVGLAAAADDDISHIPLAPRQDDPAEAS